MMSSFQKAVQHQTWPILPLVLMAQITCQLCISATGLVLSSVIGKLTRIFVTIVILFFAISGHSQSVKNTVKRKPMSRYSTLTQRVSESSPLLGIKDAQYPFIHIYVGNSVPTQTFMRDVLVAVPTIHLFLWRYKGIYRLMGKSDNLEQDLKTIQKNVAPDAYIWTLEQEDLSDHLSPEYVMDISNIDEFKSDGQRELAQTLMEIEAGGANTAALKSVALSRIGPYVEKEVSSLVQNALGSFGTADVDVDFGPDFSPKNGQIEVFLPFFTNDNSTWFAQSGVVFNEKARYEGRTFAHAGIGYRRQLSKNIMWGVNGFYDVDLIKQHKRASLGLEEWIENYKLSMNYYFPLSGWKSTDAMTDHLHSIEERPVSGFDLRGEGYLPNYPQWSAEVYYDQKLGDLVGASNDSQPRKNPYSLGFNINYTPMPLIELYSGYQYEKGAGNDFQLGIKFHYHFGKSLQSHLSNDKDLTHSNLRKSMLSRAVKRNANIGLEYRYIPFSFQLEQNHITVKEGQTIHVSDYYSVHGVQNLQRFVLEVRGSDDMSDPSTRTEVQSSQYISDLTYDMEGDQIQSTKVITIIAHLRNGRHVVSPSMHISVLASDDHNAIDIQDKEDPMTVASVKRAKESMGSDQNSEVIDPELEGNAQTDSQHLALDEGSDVKSDMSGEEPTSSSQIEGEVSEQKETLTLGKVVQNVQPAPLDEASMNVQATNPKAEGNTQPDRQPPVLDKGDVSGGMSDVSGEEPTSSGQNAEDKGSEQKETLTLGKVVQNVQPAPLDEASMNVQATNPKAEGNTQPDRQPP
ncbi:inverse autotransporter beta domain-containing protein, partial [Vibrio sp.]|uniref:inverse autotransporter beta domain-containing protein n=1 Tax=Vibrio sp. TaxID=678 RepID=UPI00311D49C7